MDVITYKEFKIHEIYRNVRVVNYNQNGIRIIQEVCNKGGLSGSIDKAFTETVLDFNENGNITFEVRE